MATNPSADWQDRRVLVTGASGLLGSWLVEALLQEGAAVAVLLRDTVPNSRLIASGTLARVSVVRAELEDYAALERTLNEHEIDVVFHLGAQAIVETAQRSPLSTFESNIRGTYQLLEACRVHAKQVRAIVVASSDKAYGEQPKLPYTESMPLLGRNPYEASKVCTDVLAQSYAHAYELPIAIVRCGNIFGGGDLHWNRIVPGTIRSFLRGQRPEIRSDGTPVRDYVYVRDVVSAYLCLASAMLRERETLRGEAFNFASEIPLSVTDLVARLQRLMACEHLKPRFLDRAKGEIPSQLLSARKARRVLGWRPTYSLDAALRETIDWYSAFLQRGCVL